MITNPIPTQPETLEKEFDEPHRWEVEPHPWDSDYDIFVTDDDEAAREAILHAAEMHLWDSNDGEERTLRVKMNDKIANVANSRRAAVTAPRGDEWFDAETAPKNIPILMLWEDQHMQIEELNDRPSFWFENAPIKWRHLPPLPNAAAATSSPTPAESDEANQTRN